jgi:hypothetical protein
MHVHCSCITQAHMLSLAVMLQCIGRLPCSLPQPLLEGLRDFLHCSSQAQPTSIAQWLRPDPSIPHTVTADLTRLDITLHDMLHSIRNVNPNQELMNGS